LTVSNAPAPREPGHCFGRILFRFVFFSLYRTIARHTRFFLPRAAPRGCAKLRRLCRGDQGSPAFCVPHPTLAGGSLTRPYKMEQGSAPSGDFSCGFDLSAIGTMDPGIFRRKKCRGDHWSPANCILYLRLSGRPMAAPTRASQKLATSEDLN